MNIKYRDVAKLSVLALFGCLVIGCGGGGSGDGSSGSASLGDSSNPKDTLTYHEIATDVQKLYLADNGSSGQTLLWVSVDNPSDIQHAFSLQVSDFDINSGWTPTVQIKENMAASEINLSRDSLGDAHVSWFTPGSGIYAQSRVNNVWQAESLLTTTGACLDMDSQDKGVGSRMLWCESGGLIGQGVTRASGWLSSSVINDANGESISGKESSLELLNNGHFLATWVAPETKNNKVVSALHIGEYSSTEVSLNDSQLTTMDVSVASINDIFTDGENSHLVVWTDNTHAPNELNVSVFDGTWSVPVVLNSAVDGYTKFDAYFLDNGDMVFLAEQFGRDLAVYYYNGSDWNTLDVIKRVASFDATVLGNELLLVYSADLETTGVKINSSGMTDTVFKIAQPVSDIRVAKPELNKTLIVWRYITTAFYAVLDI